MNKHSYKPDALDKLRKFPMFFLKEYETKNKLFHY